MQTAGAQQVKGHGERWKMCLCEISLSSYSSRLHPPTTRRRRPSLRAVAAGGRPECCLSGRGRARPQCNSAVGWRMSGAAPSAACWRLG